MSKISPLNSLDITSSDPNENAPIINLLTESDSSTKKNKTQHRTNDFKEKNPSDFEKIIIAKPVLTREILEEIQSDVQNNTTALNDPTICSKENSKIDANDTKEIQSVENTVEILESNSETIHNFCSTSSDQTSNMDIVSKSVSNIGESLVNDIKTIASAGEEKLNDLAKETEKTLKEVPKNVIDYVKTSVGLENEEKDTTLDANLDETKENTSKDSEKQLMSSKLSNEMSNILPTQDNDSNEPHKSGAIQQNNKMNALAENDLNQVDDIDESTNDIDSGVKFVNDGVEISNSSSIIQSMKDEINEMSNDVRGKSDELMIKYDEIINNDLTTAKESVSSRIFEMKNGRVLANELKSSTILFCTFYLNTFSIESSVPQSCLFHSLNSNYNHEVLIYS